MRTDPPATGRPRAFDEDTVLDRATEVFWRHGYDGASLTALTAAMGINRPSLYATFGSKEQLFQRVLARYHDKRIAEVRAALDRPTTYAAIEAFLRSSAAGLTAATHPPGCLTIQGGLACAPENAAITEVLAAARAATEDALEQRLSRADDLPGGMDARALARFAMALSAGHAVHAASGATCDDLQASVDIALLTLSAPR
ncbi:TetR/AcrR family transcriptional regulator [Actinoplanes sp. NPDC051494]|uniref:TetR/AcrR family transcriptional regulator n=1 Tax=Actinoplanes sp. NPDC051494 TaxID=3363907 RepID=UPI00379E6C74